VAKRGERVTSTRTAVLLTGAPPRCRAAGDSRRGKSAEEGKGFLIDAEGGSYIGTQSGAQSAHERSHTHRERDLQQSYIISSRKGGEASVGPGSSILHTQGTRKHPNITQASPVPATPAAQ